MFTCTALHPAFLDWQRNTGVHMKASKSMLKADRPDRPNNINYRNSGGKITSCCTIAGRKLVTSPDGTDMYTYLLNTWNTLPESYQQVVHKKRLATVKRQIQQAENQTPAVVISVEAARVHNDLLDYLTSKVALEEAEIGSTDSIIPKDSNHKDDEPRFGMPGGSGDIEDEGDKKDERDAIPTASWRRWAPTGLATFELVTSVVNSFEAKDGDDEDADEEKVASQADDGSTQNVED
jgi:hypothetical protein